MTDLDVDPHASGKIRLVFKKKNIGEWESFIKRKESPNDITTQEIKPLNSLDSQSSNEDGEISQQFHFMHVTRETNVVDASVKSVDFYNSTPNRDCFDDKSNNCAPIAAVAADDDDDDDGDLDSKDITEDNNVPIGEKLIPPENANHPQSIAKDEPKFKINEFVNGYEEDPAAPGNLQAIHAGKGPSESPTLYLLPEFSDPSNLPRPPVHPSINGHNPPSLHPSFPIIQATNLEHAYSRSLQEFCMKQNCCLVRNLCRSVDLKLEMFSTATLRQTFGDYKMEIRVQKKFRNSKRKAGGRSWNFQSKPSSITINQFARYQALSFLKATSSSSSGDDQKSLSRKDIIHFGTNVDLSNCEIWRDQLQELDKLPDFLKVYCPGKNILNHIGHNVLGVNTVQLYMKVPGCRTPGHQENNNFSAINLNIGPGSCEWFCVAEIYWGVIYNLCKKGGINYSSGSWWPDLKDLLNNNVPVYRVVQEPGDVIWVGPGTIHWVQSIGWCNNVAWNVGPMNERQFRSALVRYEYNRIDQPYKSIIPMVQLSWNLAQYFLKLDSKTCSTIDINCAEGIFRVISASLRYCKDVLIRIQKLGKRSVRQDRLPTDLAHYCETCMIEVFNIIFAHKSLVHCFACAIRKNVHLKDFYVLEEYNLDGLQNVVDEFAAKIVTFS